MMVVVTVMAGALHLFQKVRENPLSCQIRRCHRTRQGIELGVLRSLQLSASG